MNWLTDLVRPKIRNLIRKNTPGNLWHRCPGCEQMVFHKDMEENLFVCPLCQHHIRMAPDKRIANLMDEGFTLIPLPQKTKDILKFRDRKRYGDRLKEAKSLTQQEESISLVKGNLKGTGVILGVFNFDFIGGSMGVAMGEAIVHGAQLAAKEDRAYVLVVASGGARMQEGIFSLMQMPRSILGTLTLKEKGLPFITVLTNPTTGGVAASVAFLGDVVLAEPGAIIGFTGARVIQEVTGESLPDSFQTSEFQQKHGMVDLICHRKDLAHTLGTILLHLK